MIDTSQLSARYLRAATLGIVALFAALPAVVPAAALPTPPAASVSAVDPTEMRMHLEFLASEELGGRYTLSPSIKVAARYIAARLEYYGYRGGGPGGSFLQPFDVATTKIDAEKSKLTLRVGSESVDYAYGDFGTYNSPSGTAEGQVVFVGYGISAPALGHDDYAGLDVNGKIVFIAPGNPSNIDSSKIPEGGRGAAAARAHGAVGALTLTPPQYAGFVKSPEFKQWLLTREDVKLAAQIGQSGIPTITLLPVNADRLLAQIGMTVDAVYAKANSGEKYQPKALDASARFSVEFATKKESSQNVIGILEGSDPKLKDEYIALSAHYDHLKTSANGDVYHGADDDGSGTAAVLTLAHAFAIERPKRSILVVFHAGEELGLLGSEYNTDVAPAIPLEKIVANLNIDMIGRSRPEGDKEPANAELTEANAIYLIGADKISTELHRISEQTNAEFTKMRLDYTYNNPNHPQQFYYRSDHWNYAKHGIPVIFYFSGVHADYHKPTDTIEKIDFDKMTRVARLVFATGWRVANLDHRLVRDVK
jgi:hypothetical protein